ncbi:MAG: hypothetical protein ACJAZO_003444, partial [Myxococcota bacterium]
FEHFYSESSFGGTFLGGYFNPETRELFSLVRWGNADLVRTGSIVAFQVDSGDRRIITGMFPEAGVSPMPSFGSGYNTPRGLGGSGDPQPLTGAASLRSGPDGNLYVWGGGTGEASSKQSFIVRVDPTTGERTLVWMSQHTGSAGQGGTGDLTLTTDYGQCLRHGAVLSSAGYADSVSWTKNSFAVGADGDFYTTFQGVREGQGVARISADGSTCEILSRWGAGTSGGERPDDIGSGFLPQNGDVRGLMLRQGKVWGVSRWGDLLTIDIATGNRVNVGPDPSSGYSGIGYQNMFWDDTRDVIWAVGDHNAFVGSVIDPVTGQRESIYGDTTGYDSPILESDYGVTRSVSNSMLGSRAHVVAYGAVVLDPEDNNIVWAVLKGGGLMKMELSTFNNYMHSF